MIIIEKFANINKQIFSLVLCESKYHIGNRLRLSSKHLAVKKEKHICKVCNGKEVCVSKNVLSHPMLGRHHSKETKEKMRLKKLGMYDGSKHYNWNPNLTNEERKDRNRRRRNTPKDFKWIRSVLKRDNYKCRVCEKHSNKLCVHHLNGWAKFPDQRYDIDNGITLCKKHHKEFHSFCKIKNITREEFNRWMESIKIC